MICLPSKPDAETGNELLVEYGLPLGTRVVGGGADTTHPVDTHVRRELAPDLVAQSQAELHIGQPAADAASRIVLAIQVEFQLWLQNQPLREQHLVVGTKAGRGAARGADVAGRLHVEPVRCEPLHAKCYPVAARTRAEIVTDTKLAAPGGGDGVVPQRLDVAILDLALADLAFAAQPQLVLVTAVPTLNLPRLRVAVPTVNGFKLIQQ